MPYKDRNGRRIRLPSGATNCRQRLVALDGTKATFECKAGHRSTHDYSKGRVSNRMPEAFLKKMAPYWGLGLQTNGTKGHVYGFCQACQNEWDRDGILSCPRCDSAPWKCRDCGKRCCEHRCGNKTSDGVATCVSCLLKEPRKESNA
jgi:hypothetical protein